MNNFNFLKPVDKNLYEIISDAENLYRDEYFEQCITQTRRFGENVCKAVLGNFRTTEKTFDDMLATLKDKACHSIQEKEFIDDLYFLKREGNNSVHSSLVKKDGIIALECLQRAFEVAINYAVHYKKSNAKLLKTNYDITLLMTKEKGEKDFTKKYKEKITEQKLQTSKKKRKEKIKSKEKKSNSFFMIFWLISMIISLVILLTFFLITLI